MSVVVTYDKIKTKDFSLSAGQYFEVKIEYIDISSEEFELKIKDFKNNLNFMFEDSRVLSDEIQKKLNALEI